MSLTQRSDVTNGKLLINAMFKYACTSTRSFFANLNILIGLLKSITSIDLLFPAHLGWVPEMHAWFKSLLWPRSTLWKRTRLCSISLLMPRLILLGLDCKIKECSEVSLVCSFFFLFSFVMLGKRARNHYSGTLGTGRRKKLTINRKVQTEFTVNLVARFRYFFSSDRNWRFIDRGAGSNMRRRGQLFKKGTFSISKELRINKNWTES